MSMPNLNAERDPPPRPVRAVDRADARLRAYDLLIDCQVQGREALDDAYELERVARERDWDDVRALAEYVVSAYRWFRTPRDQATLTHVQSFVAWAEHSAEPLATALALVARAYAGFHFRTQARQVEDLITGYVAAERIDTVVERAFALHEVAGVFHELHLWELVSEIYDRVDQLSVGLESPRALVGSLAYNRFYTLACELLHARESGHSDAVELRAARVAALTTDHLGPAVPHEWRTAIQVHAAICQVLVGGADADAGVLRDLLEAAPGGFINEAYTRGLLRCVLGWHHLEHGRPDDAEPLVRAGSQVIIDGADPSFLSFALWLRARVQNRGASDDARAALRLYHRELLRAREDSRLSLIRSIRVQLQTERLRAERDRFARESLTDSLTGLANRRALETRLETLSTSSTLILVDIDQFKPVNDRFGHDIGDAVLRRIGQILLDCIRQGDLAARLGGDEFVLVLDTADGDVAERRGYEVRDRICNEPWDDIEPGLRVAASVGVAWGDEDGVGLYRGADTALYAAKRAGGANVHSVETAVGEPSHETRTG